MEQRDGGILFIDEIHTLAGAGAITPTAPMDAANLLKPALAERHAALHRLDHLQGVQGLVREGPGAGPPLPEDRRKRALDRGRGEDPARPEALLRGAPRRALHQRTRSSAAVELSARYIGDRKLPDKAIDVIDEVGAAQMAGAAAKRRKTIDTQGDRGGRLAKIARIPPKRVSRGRPSGACQTCERDLKTMVFGQDKADRRLERRHQAGARRAARAGEADRQLSLLRPDRRRQDRGGAPTCP